MTAVATTHACRTNHPAEGATSRCSGGGIGGDLQPIARPVPSEPTDGELHALLLAYFRAELDPDEATELLRIADARHQ